MGLRFAPLIRVSTEGQAQRGESLRTQTTQIQQYAKYLGGNIPKNCWNYSGQEHATPDYERAKLEQLLKDSAKGIFDAVIVCDASRWSRDNLKSKEGLKVLRENGIRFFVGTTEYDLRNPEHNLMIGLATEFGEFQANQQALKSITNRIERARRNIPTSGNLPYGRTFNKKTQEWGLDPEKQKNIKWAAEQYLNGMSIVKIAQVLGINFSNLWKILTQRSGTEWECRFRKKELNIDETVALKIPPLLGQKTIRAIKEQGDANRTYKHGEIKHRYLLSRMIFCKHCGYTLMAQTNKSGKQYYRHPRHRKNECTVKNWIPAEEIEDAVLACVLKMFGDTEKIEAAIKKANPDLSEVEKLKNEKVTLEEKQSKTIKKRERLINSVSNNLLTEEEIAGQIGPIRERLQTIQEQIDDIDIKLDNMPAPEEIKKQSKFAGAVLMNMYRHPGLGTIKRALEAPYEKKRAIIERTFAGKDSQGNRLGVYVEQTDDPERPWIFEIRAILDQIVEFFSDETIDEIAEDSFTWRLPAPGLRGCRFPAGTGSPEA